MEYKSIRRYSQEANKGINITDSEAFRSLVFEIINRIPDESLKRIFNFEKIDSSKIIPSDLFIDDSLSTYQREHRFLLWKNKEVEYSASIDITEPCNGNCGMNYCDDNG